MTKLERKTMELEFAIAHWMALEFFAKASRNELATELAKLQEAAHKRSRKGSRGKAKA